MNVIKVDKVEFMLFALVNDYLGRNGWYKRTGNKYEIHLNDKTHTYTIKELEQEYDRLWKDAPMLMKMIWNNYK